MQDIISWDARWDVVMEGRQDPAYSVAEASEACGRVSISDTITGRGMYVDLPDMVNIAGKEHYVICQWATLLILRPYKALRARRAATVMSVHNFNNILTNDFVTSGY